MIVSSLDVGRFLALVETTNANEFGGHDARSLVLYVKPKRVDKVHWDVSFCAYKLNAADRLGGIWHTLGIDKFPPANWSGVDPKDVKVLQLPSVA